MRQTEAWKFVLRLCRIDSDCIYLLGKIMNVGPNNSFDCTGFGPAYQLSVQYDRFCLQLEADHVFKQAVKSQAALLFPVRSPLQRPSSTPQAPVEVHVSVRSGIVFRMEHHPLEVPVST